HAAEARLLVSAEKQRSAPVRTMVPQETDPASHVPEGDQLLAQQLHPDGRAVRRGQLAGRQRRYPVLTHHVTHRGPWSHPTDRVVVFFAQHRSSPSPSTIVCPIRK